MSGLELLRRLIMDHGLHICRRGENLLVRPASKVPPEIIPIVTERKRELLQILCDSETLLQTLWAAGFHVRLVPSEGRPEGVFLLPAGNPRLPREHLEALFESYERDHDAALLTLLGRLPKTATGKPDWQWWNYAAERSDKTQSLDEEDRPAQPQRLSRLQRLGSFLGEWPRRGAANR